ncbi:hypothetical protein [Roseateles violae]|uniref:DUF4902 domain-containing protein n=1 Tax=Roseateles violae TaxID=3058042 RepID=A0ABT8DSU6_9BURK|nr:hypothetical protein [Pelomonas sp. PFR6]MDN3919231.1 hypothetical protein [Pelomonas sp. PFR6]
MFAHAWQVTTWKPVQLTPTQFSELLEKFEKISSNVLRSPRSTLRCGQALWAAPVEGRHRGDRIGIAWDWAEVREGVVALVDPMRLLSNLQLVDDDGICLDESALVVHLNTALYALDWQSSAMEQRRPS